MKKKQPAAPPVEKRRTVKVTVRLTPAEREQLNAAASIDDVELARYMRRSALAFARSGVQPRGTK